MAVRDEIREQRQKLKGQGFKAHWDYFWEYYKIHTIVAVIVVIFLVTFIRDIVNKKPYALYAMFVNSQGMEAQTFLQDGFAEYAGIDTNQETILVDTGSNFIGSTIDQTTVATTEKIMAMMSASELDVFVADSGCAYHYASQQTFIDLREVYSQAELDAMSDRLFYVDQAYADYLASDYYTDYLTNGKFDHDNKYAVLADKYNNTFQYDEIDVSEMDDPIPVGIRLTDSAAIDQSQVYPDQTPVAAIVVNSERVDNAKKFIEYLLQ
jgi:hypothetical protein